MFLRGWTPKLLRAVLDQTAARLSTEPERAAGVEADLRQILGKVYADLDDPPSAEQCSARRCALRKETLGDESPVVAEAMTIMPMPSIFKQNTPSAGDGASGSGDAQESCWRG